VIVSSATARANGVRLHYLWAGEGPPVVLLHGWPQTSHIWRHLLPRLAERHTVIAPDLRGYGLSDKPVGGYDKRTMAADVRALVRDLGHERVALVGHDRGARVAHRYALDHPEEVRRVALLDVIPTRDVIRRVDARLAAGFWHWWFHAQPDLPELLVGGRVREYLEFFFERWSYQRAGLDPQAVDHYVRAFSRPGALRAGFEDYRATDTGDLAADDASADAGARLEMPVLVLWGAEGLVATLPVREIWEGYARDLRAEAIEGCGHFLAEERPEALLERLLDFLVCAG
jgi:haloacetate dehalogenase